MSKLASDGSVTNTYSTEQLLFMFIHLMRLFLLITGVETSSQQTNEDEIFGKTTSVISEYIPI